MLTFLSILIGLFLIALGVVTISIGIRTYIRLCSTTLTTGGDIISSYHIFFSHGLTEADTPIYNPAKPLFTLVCMLVIGLIPLSFGILLFVRIAGLF